MQETGAHSVDAAQAGVVGRALMLIYGVGAYLFFFGTFVYLIGFVGNWVVPKSIDSGPAAASKAGAVATNVFWLALFALQHTVMARPAFKHWWTRVVPWPIERSTFVLLATTILALMVWQWRPLPDTVWRFDGAAAVALLSAVSLAGWGIVLVSTFLIDHFELFGVRQSVLYALGRPIERPEFQERLFYRWVRHPLMLGFLVAFWATPVMTEGHLLFAAVTTAYILFGIQVEERTLLHLHGAEYEAYRRRVPMLVPRGSRRTQAH